MDINDIIELYQKGKSLAFIANKYNTYGDKIKRILKENGITIRTKAEQNKITNQERGKKVNHQYFDNIDSLQKAWILGFIAADGSVASDRNRIKISLSGIDKDILEKIRQEIEVERVVKCSTTNQGFSVAALAWSSENHKRKLAQYSIVPNKTYKGIRLPHLDTDYQLAYLLGYFDGDGCFKDDGATCRIEICSYDFNILQDFVDLVYKIFKIQKTVYKDPSRKDYYTITYSTKQAVIILDYLYNLMNKANYFYLRRKYDKYLTWKKRNNKI